MKAHQPGLSQKPVAYFLTALSLTRMSQKDLNGIPIFQGPALAKAPKNAAKPSLKENYATVANYMAPALKKAQGVRPVSVGLFAGKLDFHRLNLFSRLFVQFVNGARPGDFRNWEAIRAWAASLN